jgi:hypothetical protein
MALNPSGCFIFRKNRVEAQRQAAFLRSCLSNQIASPTMKKIYLLAACFAIAHWANAQQKMEFGLVAKAGNFTLPEYKEVVGFEARQKIMLYPGVQLQLGAYAQRSLNRRLSLSAGLLYQHSAARKWENIWMKPSLSEISASADINAEIAQGSLTLPIGLHFQPLQWAKTSLSVGWSPVYTLFNSTRLLSNNSPIDDEPSVSPDYYCCDCLFIISLPTESIGFYSTEKVVSRFQSLITGGLKHRIARQTTVGIEFALSLGAFRQTSNFHYQYDCCTPRFMYEIPEGRYPIFTKNISVSLFHNLLK